MRSNGAGALVVCVRGCIRAQDARWMPMSELKRESTHPLLQRTLEVSAGVKAVPILEEEMQSVITHRPPFKLYHAPLSSPH